MYLNWAGGDTARCYKNINSRLEDSEVRLPTFEELKSDDRIFKVKFNVSCTSMTIWPGRTKVKVLMYLNLVILDLAYTK